MRFTWSNITAAAAHWEQAFSGDGGKTWETNGTADFGKIHRTANLNARPPRTPGLIAFLHLGFK